MLHNKWVLMDLYLIQVTSGKEDHEAEAETSDEEPTTLIDPVTGMLMVMRAKEEGKYVPVANVPPIAPPTPPPPPPTKSDVIPIATEGLASHWLTHETLKVCYSHCKWFNCQCESVKYKYQ